MLTYWHNIYDVYAGHYMDQAKARPGKKAAPKYHNH
jgi:hypothetical protein